MPGSSSSIRSAPHFNPTAGALQEEAAQDPGEAFKAGKTAEGSREDTRSGRFPRKTMTLNNAQQKVNDVDGNPVIIGSVVISEGGGSDQGGLQCGEPLRVSFDPV